VCERELVRRRSKWGMRNHRRSSHHMCCQKTVPAECSSCRHGFHFLYRHDGGWWYSMWLRGVGGGEHHSLCVSVALVIPHMNPHTHRVTLAFPPPQSRAPSLPLQLLPVVHTKFEQLHQGQSGPAPAASCRRGGQCEGGPLGILLAHSLTSWRLNEPRMRNDVHACTQHMRSRVPVRGSVVVLMYSSGAQGDDELSHKTADVRMNPQGKVVFF
jgi:hypothetical protein